MHQLKQSILKVVAYFDVFDYPVNAAEIKSFLDCPYTESNVDFALQQLAEYGAVYRFSSFYSLRNNYALVERRIKGNQRAESKLRQAGIIASFLMWFPFIKGVAVSGSLSKNFAYKGSDIDFFIVTKANRLWVARMFLIVFYKIAKTIGLGNYFCLNYFIDETALEIPEHNIYTAIEIATLMPKQGCEIFKQFFAANKWVYDYLPNHTTRHAHAVEKNKLYLKRLAQWLLNGRLGTFLDNFLMHFYKVRWEKMMAQKRYAKTGFQFGSYIAGKHVCKPIPHYFQNKVLAKFGDRISAVNGLYYPAEQVAV